MNPSDIWRNPVNRDVRRWNILCTARTLLEMAMDLMRADGEDTEPVMRVWEDICEEIAELEKKLSEMPGVRA